MGEESSRDGATSPTAGSQHEDGTTSTRGTLVGLGIRFVLYGRLRKHGGTGFCSAFPIARPQSLLETTSLLGRIRRHSS